jgi:hypothetical protein
MDHTSENPHRIPEAYCGKLAIKFTLKLDAS